MKEIELKMLPYEHENHLQHMTIKSGPTDKLTVSDGESVCADSDDHIDRPSIRGPYKPLRTGTVRGSLFALLGSVLGTGNLNLPLRIDHLGLVPFILVVLMTALLSYFGMYLMSKFIVRFKVVSYSQMVRKTFGERIMRISESVLIFYPWAVTVSHQVILSKFTMQLLHDQLGLACYDDREKEDYNRLGHLVRVIVAFVIVGLNWRNFFNKDLREMLHSLGLFSVTGVVFNMIVIVGVSFTGFTKQYNGQTIEYKGILEMDYSQVDLFKSDTLSQRYLSIFLQGISGIFYTFLNPQFIFPLISHLKRPTLKRVNYIFRMAHIEEVVIYLLIAICGYLLLAQHRDILPISPLIITSISIAPLVLGKIALTCSTFLTLPLHVFTAREYLHEALDLQRNDRNQRYITYSLVGSSMLVSIAFQQITSYYGIIGGVSGIIIACLIPAACMMRKMRLKTKHLRILAYVGGVSALAFIGGFLSVLDPA